MTFRLPLPVYHELERMSERERLSMNQACIRVLEKGLGIERPTA